MKYIICEDGYDLGFKLGGYLANFVKNNPSSVLGLATGSSPIETYHSLAKANVSFRNIKTFNLDEYIDCKIEKEKYSSFMYENLFKDIDIDLKNTHFPSLENMSHYDEMIKSAGGIDIQLLGIGRNGHIGFNEPGTPLDSTTGVVNLSESTRNANARFFNNDINLVPKKAISMGLKSIMMAKKIILIINSKDKVDAMRYLKNNIQTVDCPATCLLGHPDVDIYITKEVFDLL